MVLRKLLIGFSFVSSMGISLLLSGCANLLDVHKIDINQGNVITQSMVDQLEPGMDRTQVHYVMGSPMLESVFHANRWDYIYRRQPGGEPASQKRVILYFDQDRLSRIEGDYRPMPAD